MRASIIGGGIIGCSIAFELQKLGFECTVLERHGAVGHGSTSASCGIVRRFYSQTDMIAIANEAAHIWADWLGHVGLIADEGVVFQRPGMLFIPPRIDQNVSATVERMKTLGIPASILSEAQTKARFPFLETASFFPPSGPGDKSFFEPTGRRIEGAVYEEDAGYVLTPDLATQNLGEAARREGARFLLNHEVQSVRKVSPKRFEIVAANGVRLESELVVNAAGPHSSIVNRISGVRLPLEIRPLRREVHVLANPLYDEGASLPVIGDMDGGVYCRPESGGRDAVVGTTDPDCDQLEWVEDPDDFRQEVTATYWERQCLRLMKRIPKFRLGHRRGLSALYDVTVADWYPIVDRTELPGYYVCIGTSGSSFKTAPVLGWMLASMIEQSEKGRDLDRDPIRFTLPRTGVDVHAAFLSRNRNPLDSTGTVIG